MKPKKINYKKLAKFYRKLKRKVIAIRDNKGLYCVYLGGDKYYRHDGFGGIERPYVNRVMREALLLHVNNMRKEKIIMLD